MKLLLNWVNGLFSNENFTYTLLEEPIATLQVISINNTLEIFKLFVDWWQSLGRRAIVQYILDCEEEEQLSYVEKLGMI